MPIITISEETTTGSKTPDWAMEIFEETVRLDEEVHLRAGTRVTLLKLMPLAGG